MHTVKHAEGLRKKTPYRRPVNSRSLVWSNLDGTVLSYTVHKIELINDVQVGTYINEEDNIRGNRK